MGIGYEKDYGASFNKNENQFIVKEWLSTGLERRFVLEKV